MIGILLVDDAPLLRMGFRMVLEAQPDMTVIGEAGDGAEAVALAARLDPDVVLMDVRMPGMDGIEATARISAECPDSRVLILTTFDLDEYAFAALRAGAAGFLLKNALPAELIAGVRTVAAGDGVVASRVTRQLIEAFAAQPGAGGASGGADPRLERLTEREREVLIEMARGRSNAEIAEAMNLSEAHREDARLAHPSQAGAARPGAGRRLRVRQRAGKTLPEGMSFTPSGVLRHGVSGDQGRLRGVFVEHG